MREVPRAPHAISRVASQTRPRPQIPISCVTFLQAHEKVAPPALETIRESSRRRTANTADSNVATHVPDGHGLLMNGHLCPRCGSDDLKLARVIYEAGTAATQSKAHGSSIHTSGDGQFSGVSYSDTAMESITQTELAAQCTPPRPPNLQPFVMLVAIPSGLWAIRMGSDALE